jgi:hypothetical protein
MIDIFPLVQADKIQEQWICSINIRETSPEDKRAMAA